MDKANCCPKCNYSDKAEIDFQVCPRCGLIIAKYFQHKNKSETAIKPANRTSSIQIKSEATRKSHFVKKLIRGILCILILILALIFICKYFETASGTIIWSQTSAGAFNVTAMAIDENFIYLAGGERGLDISQGLWRIEKRKLSNGNPVSGFGIDGAVTSRLGVRSSWITGVAVDSQYLYVVGFDNSPGMHQSQWRMEKRRLLDGILVAEFGNGGVVTSHPSNFFEGPRSIAIDANYMYVGGYEAVVYGNKDAPHYHPDYAQWRIEKRKLSDGLLDSNFGTGGVITNNANTIGSSAGLDGVYAIAIDADYMYVIGKGVHAAPIDTLWIIDKMRLTDGSYCKEFGNNGVVMQNPSTGYDEPHGLAIDDKYMYVVGHDMSSGSSIDHQWHIEKRNLSDGTLIGKFGNNGIVTNNPSNRVDWAYAIVLDQKPGLWKRILDFDLFRNRQAMYVVGKDESPGTGDQEWRIEKRTLSNGSLIPAFGNAGSVTINPSRSFESASAIAADSDYIYVAGEDICLGLTDCRCRIVKIKK